jgi:predicted transcriptional regulator
MILLLIFVQFSPVQSQTDDPLVMILYNERSELDYISNIVDSFEMSYNSLNIGNFGTNSLSSYQLVFLISSAENSFEDLLETELENYISRENTSLIVFTPYLDGLSEEFLDKIGILETDDIYPDEDEGENMVKWDLEVQSDYADNLISEDIDYIGNWGTFTPKATAEVIATITGSNSTEETITELNYPLPAILNYSSTTNKILTSSLALTSIPDGADDDNTDGLGLSQIPNFDQLIINLFSSYLTSFGIEFNVGSPSTDNPDNINNPSESPSVPELVIEYFNYIWILLLLLAMVFYQKVLGLFRWFSEKSIGGFVFVLGAFYNVQNRSISESEVLLNNTRNRILDYLDYLKIHGAHIREIKSALKIGTGSLLWNLQVLEDYGWIDKVKINRNVVYVSTDFIEKFDLTLKEIELKLKSKYTISIMDVLMDPAVSLKEMSFSKLATISQADRKTIRRILNILLDYEIIDLIYEGNLFDIEIKETAKLKQLYSSLNLRDSYVGFSKNISIDHLQ